MSGSYGHPVLSYSVLYFGRLTTFNYSSLKMGCQVHQSCRKQFRLVSLLSVPNKILEAETNDRLVKMVKMSL